MPFDRRGNVGLHHLALKVVDRSALEALHARVAAWLGTVVEFAPERSARAPRYILWCESLAAPGSSSPAFLLPLDSGSPVALPLLRGSGDQCKSLASAVVMSLRAGLAATHRQCDAQADCGGLH
jgi:hypothetical protein